MITVDAITIAAIGLLFTAAGFLVARINEQKAEATSSATDMTGVKDSLDYIKETVRDTRSDVRSINAKLSDHSETIARLVADGEARDKRLDNVESRLSKGGL